MSERPGGISQEEGSNMVKYEYLPLSASDRNAEGSDQIQYSPGQPGAEPGNDAQAQLPSDSQPVLPNERGEFRQKTAVHRRKMH